MATAHIPETEFHVFSSKSSGNLAYHQHQREANASPSDLEGRTAGLRLGGGGLTPELRRKEVSPVLQESSTERRAYKGAGSRGGHNLEFKSLKGTPV